MLSSSAQPKRSGNPPRWDWKPGQGSFDRSAPTTIPGQEELGVDPDHRDGANGESEGPGAGVGAKVGHLCGQLAGRGSGSTWPRVSVRSSLSGAVCEVASEIGMPPSCVAKS